MRRTITIFITILGLTACGDDESDDGADTGADDGATLTTTAGETDTGADDSATMTTTMTSTTMTSTTMTTTVADTGTEDDTGTETGTETGEAGPPVIDMVTWTQVEGCMAGTGSDVTITIAVTDPDNDVSELTFEGMSIGCTGMIDAAEVTILCPQAAPYNTTVTVTDPDGGSDMIEFTIDVCEDGTAP